LHTLHEGGAREVDAPVPPVPVATPFAVPDITQSSLPGGAERRNFRGK
jgi:hypothetical protein